MLFVEVSLDLGTQAQYELHDMVGMIQQDEQMRIFFRVETLGM